MQKQACPLAAAVLCLTALSSATISPSLLAAESDSGPSPTFCRLRAATYFGASGNEHGWPSTPSAIDADGNVLFAIATTSPNLAFEAYDTSYNGGGDVLIVRMNPDLTRVLSATYLGGSASEVPDALSIDNQGRIYVSGSTSSADFPTTPGAYDVAHDSAEDAFVTILSGSLDSVLSSTLIGGNGSDMECTAVFSADGSVFAAIRTASTDLPTSPGAIQSSHSPGDADFYIMRLDSNLTAALASTYYGGNGSEFRPRVAIDHDGNIYITGSTFSSDLPMSAGAWDTENNDGSLDAFVSHISNNLDTVLASTYVGGNGTDWSYAILLGGDDVYITGHAHSNWPTTPGCLDSTYGGGPEEGSDSYLARLSGDLTTLEASTYLGGTGWDWGVDLARDGQGHIYVVGETTSPDFPVTSGAYDSACCDAKDMFLVEFDSTMQTMHLSTLIGGLSDDRWPGVISAADDCVYAIGYTTSIDLQTTPGAYHGAYGGKGDMYVVRFSLDPYLCGDINGDFVGPDIADLVYLVTYMFDGGPQPPLMEACDVDGSESGPDIADLVYLLTYMFGGGPGPQCP